MPRAARVLARIALIVLAPIVALAFLELGVQLAGAAPPRPAPLSMMATREDMEMRAGRGLFQTSYQLLWNPRPGADAKTAYGDAVNEDSRRGERVPLEKNGKFRIATLGDSSTFGMNVRNHECFAQRLGAMLNERGVPTDVVNDGCIGYTSAQGVAVYRTKTTRWKPDVVIAAFGAINEQFINPQGLGDIEKMKIFSSPFIRARLFLERYDAFRWLDALMHPVPEVAGQGRNAPDAIRKTSPDKASRPRVTLEEFEDLLRQLNELVRADGGQLLLVRPPRRRDCEIQFPTCLPYSEALPKIAEKLKIPLVDVLALMRKLDEEDPVTGNDSQESRRFTDAYHPSPEGHQIYAEALLAKLDELGWIPKE